MWNCIGVYNRNIERSQIRTDAKLKLKRSKVLFRTHVWSRKTGDSSGAINREDLRWIVDPQMKNLNSAAHNYFVIPDFNQYGQKRKKMQIRNIQHNINEMEHIKIRI